MRICCLLFTAFPCALAGANEASLRDRDSLYRHGRISFHLKIAPPRTYGSSGAEDCDGSLVFDDKGRMMETYFFPLNRGPGVKKYVLVKGAGWRYTEVDDRSGTTVSFVDAASWPRLSLATQDLLEVPCSPLALGLGKAKDIEFTEDAFGSEFRGSEYHQSTFLLRFDKAGMPAKLERRSNGKLLTAWQYSGKVETGTKLLLPREAKLTVRMFGPKPFTEYSIRNADLSFQPTERDLQTKWLRPGVTIIDRRVDPVATWTYEELISANGGSNQITSDQLLVLSKELARFFQKEDRRKGALVTLLSSPGGGKDVTGYIWCGAAVVATILGIFALWRVKSAPKAKGSSGS
jgi:hypothetical protein